MSNARLDALIDAYLSEELSEADAEELRQLVLDDPAAMRRCRSQALLDAEIRAAVDDDGARLWSGIRLRLAAQGETSRFRAQVVRRCRARRRRSSSPWPWALAAAALIMVLGGVLWQGRTGALAVLHHAPPGIHVLRGDREIAASSGMALLAHDLLRLPGEPAEAWAELHFPDRSRISMRPGTETRLWDEGGAKRFDLSRGALRCEVSPQPAGSPLRIRTPHALATVLGTTFDLVVDDHTTHLAVSSGTVRLQRHGDPSAVDVYAGDSAVAGRDARPDATAASTAQQEPQPRWSRGISEDPDFFPIAAWMQDPQYAARYRQAGINLYLGLWQDPDAEQMAMLRQAGMGLILDADAIVPPWRDDPTVVGWFLGDAVDNARLRADGGYDPPETPSALLARYHEAVRLDPTRPVLAIFGHGAAWDGWFGRGERTQHPEDYRGYLQACDIALPTIYPVAGLPDAATDRLWYPAQGVRRLRDWSDGSTAVWPLIETSRMQAGRPAPTADQIRAEVWLALIEGANGLVYHLHEQEPGFNDHALLDAPELLAAVTALNHQIQTLAPVLNAADVGDITVTSSNPDFPIACLAKRYRGTLHLFVIATRDGGATATIAVPGLPDDAVIEVVDEERTLGSSGGRFSDVFAPYQLHHYRIP